MQAGLCIPTKPVFSQSSDTAQLSRLASVLSPFYGAADWRGRQRIHSFLLLLFYSLYRTGVRAQCYLLTSFS